MDNPEYEGWTERKIAIAHIHPQFDRYSSYYDLAVLQLNEPVQFRERIQPICLPQLNNRRTNNGNMLRVIGWGLTDSNEKNSVLRNTFLELFSAR